MTKRPRHPEEKKPNHQKCGVTGKVRWPSQEEAERQLGVVQMLGPCWHKEQRVYKCQHCGGFHLTSQNKKGRGEAGAGQEPN